jgi:truncated hemoglobin YjbI
LKECDDDFNKMLKKFTKKVRKEEVLKPFYGKLMFYTTKGQKKRKRKLKGIWNTKKHEQKLLDE